MRLPRMTTRRWMITVAFVALALGFAMEWRRLSADRHGVGYAVARSLIAARHAGRSSGSVGTGDPCLVLGFAATVLIGIRLRRRFLAQC